MTLEAFTVCRKHAWSEFMPFPSPSPLHPIDSSSPSHRLSSLSLAHPPPPFAVFDF